MTSLNILFVCMANTCRSPMAESVMLHLARENSLDWKTDSAGIISLNVGRSPEPRCIKVLEENGMTTEHIGRKITLGDFHKFDYIFGMDEMNMEDLIALSEKAGQDHKARIELLGSYIGRKEDEIIQDPYFSTGIGSFRCAFSQINESCKNFIKRHKSKER